MGPSMQTIDTQNMKAVLDNFPQQCKQALMLGRNIKIKTPISALVFCGVGGSAIPADIIKAAFDLPFPVIETRDYTIPKWVKSDALVFAISYSGDTEETIANYSEARKRGCQIISLSSGGKLYELCRQYNTPHIAVPKGIQPRDAIGYQTLPLLNVLIDNRILGDRTRDDMEDMISIISGDYHAKAKPIAEKLIDKVPLIYASRAMSVAAHAWKTKINENAKVHAFWNEFPELNHNEIVGFTSAKSDFFVIMIEDDADHPRTKKRMEITRDLIKEKGTPVFMMKLTGRNALAKIFSAIYLGSYVGYELALRYNTDPSPVEIVQQLKRLMKG